MNPSSRTRYQLAGESYGLLVDDHPCNTAIVFVHGFGGNSEKTWWQFQTLPDRLADTWWHFCDFYFYSYDSTGMQIWPNVSALNVFMKRVFPKPDWRNLGAITSGPEKKYTHLVAVAHSEGAVLVRGAVVERAMSYATRSPSTSVFQAELRMFAPAMFGAMICGWKGVLLKSPVLGSLVRSCLNSSPAYQQLVSDDPVLRHIRNETVDLAKRFPELIAFRARNIFSRKDSVASICPLPTDFECQYEAEKSHTSICKPSTMYLRPLTFVRDMIHAKAA